MKINVFIEFTAFVKKSEWRDSNSRIMRYNPCFTALFIFSVQIQSKIFLFLLPVIPYRTYSETSSQESIDSDNRSCDLFTIRKLPYCEYSLNEQCKCRQRNHGYILKYIIDFIGKYFHRSSSFLVWFMVRKVY